ncbi:MAG: hypothetical protein ACETVZ_00270 [Phycisphaerae bacterium]
MKRDDDVKNKKPGSEPLDLETVWGIPEEDLPEQEPKDHFAPEDEELPG